MKLKMKLIAAFKIWIVIYPSLLFFQYTMTGSLSAMPLYLRTLLLTVVLVPWVVFAGVPFVNYLIRRISRDEKI